MKKVGISVAIRQKKEKLCTYRTKKVGILVAIGQIKNFVPIERRKWAFVWLLDSQLNYLK